MPLRPTGALGALGALEDDSQRQDFALDTEGAKHCAYLVDLHNNYLAAVAKTSVTGGTVGLDGEIIARMKLHHAARFRRIRAEASAGTSDRETRINGNDNDKKFKTHRDAIDAGRKEARQDLFRAHDAQGYLRLRDEAQRMAKMRYGAPVDKSLTQRHE